MELTQESMEHRYTLSRSNMPVLEQGQSTAVLAQFDLLSMGGRGEGKRGGRSLTYFPLRLATACDTSY